jgi:hypothetical protein
VGSVGLREDGKVEVHLRLVRSSEDKGAGAGTPMLAGGLPMIGLTFVGLPDLSPGARGRAVGISGAMVQGEGVQDVRSLATSDCPLAKL